VGRAFNPAEPDRLWCMDVTEHPTGDGKVYLAVVLDAFSRMVVGWSIAEHMRAELVVDALQMAIWRRRPPAGQCVAHSDHGSQYTSWAFGRSLRAAGLLGSTGSVGDAYDNSVVESFFGTLQLELLDQHVWTDRRQLALAVFEWIEAWYNPRRRHTYCAMLSPADHEAAHTVTPAAA
jgi:putative transposase